MENDLVKEISERLKNNLLKDFAKSLLVGENGIWDSVYCYMSNNLPKEIKEELLKDKLFVDKIKETILNGDEFFTEDVLKKCAEEAIKEELSGYISDKDGGYTITLNKYGMTLICPIEETPDNTKKLNEIFKDNGEKSSEKAGKKLLDFLFGSKK